MPRNKGVNAIESLKELCEKCRYWGVCTEAKEIMVEFLLKEDVIEPVPRWGIRGRNK